MTFLQDFQVVEQPYRHVTNRLMSDSHSLLTSTIESARTMGDRQSGRPGLDRILLHRVAEATARTFLVNLCGNLN